MSRSEWCVKIERSVLIPRCIAKFTWPGDLPVAPLSNDARENIHAHLDTPAIDECVGTGNALSRIAQDCCATE
jgi:hypothetical protein